MWRKIFGFVKGEPPEPRQPSPRRESFAPPQPDSSDSESSDPDFSFPRLRHHIDFRSHPPVQRPAPAPKRRVSSSSSSDSEAPQDKSPRFVRFLDDLPRERTREAVEEPVSILRASQQKEDDRERAVKSMFQSIGGSAVSTPTKVSFQKPHAISFSTPKKQDMLKWDMDDDDDLQQVIAPKPQNQAKKQLSLDRFEDVDPPKARKRRYC